MSWGTCCYDRAITKISCHEKVITKKSPGYKLYSC